MPPAACKVNGSGGRQIANPAAEVPLAASGGRHATGCGHGRKLQ